MTKEERLAFAAKTERFTVNEFLKNGYIAEIIPFKSAKQNHIEGDWVLYRGNIKINIEQKASYGDYCISFNVEDDDKIYSIEDFIGEIKSDFIIGLANYGKPGHEEYILYKMDAFKKYVLSDLNNSIIRDSNDDKEHNPRYINLLNPKLRANVENYMFSGSDAIKNLYNKIVEIVCRDYVLN